MPGCGHCFIYGWSNARYVLQCVNCGETRDHSGTEFEKQEDGTYEVKASELKIGDRIVTARYLSGRIKRAVKVERVEPCTQIGKTHVNKHHCYDNIVELDVV